MSADLQSILRLEVPLIVELATTRMSVAELSNLVPGAIIELPKRADDPLEILVTNKTIGLGTAVKVGEHFGVQINQVGDLRERIAALGGPDNRPARPLEPAPAGAAPDLVGSVAPESS